MTKRRRTTEVFTLSFLDCICCGFGAVILFYTIVSAHSGVVRIGKTDNLTAEVSRLDEQVVTGSRNLAALRDTLEKTKNEAASAKCTAAPPSIRLRSPNGVLTASKAIDPTTVTDMRGGTLLCRPRRCDRRRAGRRPGAAPASGRRSAFPVERPAE